MIFENAKKYSSDQAFLHNARIFLPDAEQSFRDIYDLFSHEISKIYQSNLAISLIDLEQEPFSFKSYLTMRFLGFDHQELELQIDTILARKMLAKRLGKNLIDDSHGELFSLTENGIFSFLIAEILSKISHPLLPKMLLDISLDPAPTHEKVALSFLVTFEGQNFLARLLVNDFPIKKPKFTHEKFLNRLGHLRYPLSFSIKNLDMPLALALNLQFGDLIMFDTNGSFLGPMKASWHELSLIGSLLVKDDQYQFLLENIEPFKENEMEVVSEVFTKVEPKNKVISITESLRINVSIELSRVSLTFKDVANLKEGELIDLKRNISDPLALVIEGKTVGYCQPIQIDGRLGVRILEMSEP
jgi:flagellar motor switch/type III secretory pathway protein FliN